MNKLTKIIYLSVALFLLVGCGSNANKDSSSDPSENSSVIESTEEDTYETDENASASELEESDTNDADDTSSEESIEGDSDSTLSENSGTNVNDKESKETLSQYTNEQIEYARVWSQLGPNQEIAELNVRHISSEEPINPNDDTSAAYPEDVIQLAGSRLVDGSVTYSGNGDGTINVYNVPLRWDGNYPADKSLYTDIIENTELVSIEPRDDEEIIELIELLNVQ